MVNATQRDRRALGRLAVLLLWVAASGASCNRQWLNRSASGPAAPQVLMPGADLTAIASAINQNTERIRYLSAPSASITIPGAMASLPLLRGRLAVARPGKEFRLTAGTGITGQEVDIGSNNELFWFWVRRNQPPAAYFCRHDQFAGSSAYQIMPIEPEWLQSAIGLVQLDPSLVMSPPLPKGDGTIEIRTLQPSSQGSLQRVLVVDATRGWVTEQHIYDPSGQTLIASAVAQSHRYYPLEQVSLPERVTLRLPTAGLALDITLGQMTLNQMPAGGNQLWSMPSFSGHPLVNLATLPGNAGSVQSNIPSRGATQPLSQARLGSGQISPVGSIRPLPPLGNQAPLRVADRSQSSVRSAVATSPINSLQGATTRQETSPGGGTSDAFWMRPR